MLSMEQETEHEMKVRSRGKRTEYNRTSPVTEYLAHNFMIMTALQQTAAARTGEEDGGHFSERCQELSSVACTESSDGRFRTFSGCGNNLDNPQYGEILCLPVLGLISLLREH